MKFGTLYWANNLFISNTASTVELLIIGQFQLDFCNYYTHYVTFKKQEVAYRLLEKSSNQGGKVIMGGYQLAVNKKIFTTYN